MTQPSALAEFELLQELRRHERIFALLEEGDGSELALQKRLRRDFPDEVVRAALLVHALRGHAAERFSRAARIWMDRKGLEQATAEAVASHKTQRFTGLGARIPIYGPLDAVVPRKEAAAWLRTLLTMGMPRRKTTAYALVHLGRRTGDRSRDVPEDLFKHLNGWLRRLDDAAHYQALLTNPDPSLHHEGIDWLLAEPLPATAPTHLLDPHGIAFAAEGQDGT